MLRWVILVALGATLASAPQSARAAPADDAARQVAAHEAALARLRADKAAVGRTHRQQTAEVARLKSQRSSWGRDRKLRAALARARGSANRLAELDRRLRAEAGRLRRAREGLLSAADAEVAGLPGPTDARRAQLERWRRAARAALEPPVRRIVLPDQRIDPLADAAELGAQARLIADTERQLAREEQQLAVREQRYLRIARLQRQRRRASEADLFDDDRTRRITGRIGSTDLTTAESEGGAADDASGAPAPPAGPEGAPQAPVPRDPVGDGSGDRAADPTVVLADVVDADTISALRRAERSNDPAAKAAAAARARAQVAARRQRLKQVRERIRRRINEMSR